MTIPGGWKIGSNVMFTHPLREGGLLGRRAVGKLTAYRPESGEIDIECEGETFTQKHTHEFGGISGVPLTDQERLEGQRSAAIKPGNYLSFLICDHPDRNVVNLYIAGLAIGILRAGVFEPDPLLAHRNPFKTLDELRDYVTGIVRQMAPPIRGHNKYLGMIDEGNFRLGGPSFEHPGEAEQTRVALMGEDVDNLAKICAELEAEAAAPIPTFTQAGTIAPGAETEVNLNSRVIKCVHNADGQCVLTYEEIMRLSMAQIEYERGLPPWPEDKPRPNWTCVYHHRVPFDKLPGERSGSLCKGQKVVCSPGMSITCISTG